jgi:hypothetical protein
MRCAALPGIRNGTVDKESFMKITKLACAGFGAVAMMVAGMSSSRAQVPLSAYTDANGFIDVQALTCAQLAGTFQEDADMLAAWYSGWYNGLAKKHFAHIVKVKPSEHLVFNIASNTRNLKSSRQSTSF